MQTNAQSQNDRTPLLRFPHGSVPIAVQRFLLILVGASAICLVAEAFCRWVLHLGYPYNWPLMFPHPSFFDFEAYFDQFQRFHTTSFFEGPYLIMYPTPVVVCYWFFYRFQPFATVVFIGLIMVTSLAAAAMAMRAFIRNGMGPAQAAGVVTAVYLLAYPLWFEAKQANMEIVVWLATALGVLCFLKRNDWTAAALFGFAGALKFYPIIYLGLLWARKRYAECVFGCSIAAATLVGSLYFVGPTTRAALQGMRYGLRVSKYDFLLVRRPHEMGFDHSLFGLVKAFIAVVHHGEVRHFPPSLLSSYLLIVGLVGIALFLLRIQKLPVANQVLCLTVASILLPPLSFDYTLLHLYVPWALLVLVALRAQQEGVAIAGLTPIFVLMALGMAPLSELIFRQERVGGELRAIFLTALFIVGLLYPLALSDEECLHTQSV